jgi:anti-sigma-K factor RskA
MDIKEYISSGIIEMYVMGLCSTTEEKELEQLRSQYPELHQAVIDYEVQLEKNMLQNSTLPSAATDETILQKLESLQQGKLVSIKNHAPVRKINWLKPVAAAAMLLLIGSAYFNYIQYKKNKQLKDLVAAPKTSPLPMADYEIITDPAITPVAMYGVGSHAICRCTMFWDKKTGKAYIMIHHLPKSSDTKDYQLWAEVNGKPVSVGIINDGIRGRFIEVPGIPSDAIAFSVTLENAGGNPAPTESETYLKGKI